MTNTRSFRSRRCWQRLIPALVLLLIAACASRKPVHSELKAAAAGSDMLALSDALETLINNGQDTPADREYAYEALRQHSEDTAAGQFACAVITGRLVQQRGLLGANLLGDIERCARRSRELDPDFRDGAATRLLGTLYVIAPATLLKIGDSETGIDLLEGLVAARPDVVENHLRLAEAYITLSDVSPAYPHLCYCLDHQAALRHEDQLLLKQLVTEAGTLDCSTPTGAAP